MSNHARSYGQTSFVPTLDRLRASDSVIDKGTVILIDAGLASYAVPFYRKASKALAYQQSQPGYGQTYLAIIEFLMDEHKAARQQTPKPVGVVKRWRAQKRGDPVFGVLPLTTHEIALFNRLNDMHELAWYAGDTLRAAKITAVKIQLNDRIIALTREGSE